MRPRVPDRLAGVMASLEACRPGEALEQLRAVDVHALAADECGQARAMEATGLAWEGRIEEARRQVEAAIATFGLDRRALLAMGLRLSDLGEYRLAEQVLRRLCRLGRRNAVSLYHLADTLQRSGRPERAILHFDRAAALMPDFPQAYRRLAECLRDLGETRQAALILERYLSMVPADAAPWITLGSLYGEIGKFADAERCYTRAAQLAPQSLWPHFNRALTAHLAGAESALTQAHQILEALAPDDWRTALVRGLDLQAVPAPWAAWEALREAIALAREAAGGPALELTQKHALNFVIRQAWPQATADLVEEVYRNGVFSMRLLEALRLLSGRPWIMAADYIVLVEECLPPIPAPDDPAQPLADESAQTDPAPPTAARPERGVRVCRVWARQRVQAQELALAFEKRCGATGLHVLQVRRQRRRQREVTGVWWRSSALYRVTF